MTRDEFVKELEEKFKDYADNGYTFEDLFGEHYKDELDIESSDGSITKVFVMAHCFSSYGLHAWVCWMTQDNGIDGISTDELGQ